MNKSLAAATLALLFAAACNPSIPQTTPTSVVVALFDPGANPPVVPAPNDLATNPATGLLNIPVPPGASAADTDFAAYLDTLDGYPPDSPATLQFSGGLVGSSVSSTNVLVFDCGTTGCTSTYTPVTLTPQYADITNGGTVTGGQIAIPPPATGWTPGHSYAVAVLGSSNAKGIQGANALQVVGSQVWYLVRDSNSLVTGCTDANLDPTVCQSSTSLIPNGASAVQLEQLRLKYKPLLDTVATGSVQRSDVVLAWTFKIGDFTTLVFEPALNPPQVPIPNDLAINPVTGLVNAPLSGLTDAGYEFTHDYVNNLNGFPVLTAGVATAAGGALDSASISANLTVDGGSVLVLDLTGGGVPVAATVAYDSVANAIDIQPPGAWTKGHQYAVAIITNADTLATPVTASGGQPVIGTDIWALVRSADPLVTGCSPTPMACALAQTAPPSGCQSTLTLAAISGDQAFGLECLRLSYSPILDSLSMLGVNRGDVGLLWTFTIDGFPEATFVLDPVNPSNSIIPFPNDLLTVLPLDGGSQVNLPVPASGPLRPLILGLNTLDGFSETAPAVSAQGPSPVPAIDIGSVDPNTLGSAFVVGPDGGTGFVEIFPVPGPAQVTACVSCMSSLQPDGGPDPVEQIQFVPNVPLKEKGHYAAFITSAAKNTAGQPITASLTFALIRMSNSLVDANGHSTVPGVSDLQANGLEPLRRSYQPVIDGLVAQAGLQRATLSQFWTYGTQSTVSQLQALHGAPAQIALGGMPTVPLYLADITTSVPWGALPHTSVGKVFSGEIWSPNLLTGPSGTINPLAPDIQHVPVLITEPCVGISPCPTATAPTAGWPVVIFGHGITRTLNDDLAIANTLAAGGYASIATDIVFHGDRATCIGSGAFLTAVLGTPVTDDAACTSGATCDETSGKCIGGTRAACTPVVITTQATWNADELCQAAGAGDCNPTDSKCQGVGVGFLPSSASDPTPAISGWNFLNLTNFFATRDNFRQQVVDEAALIQIIKSTSTGNLNTQLGAGGGQTLDGTHIHWVSQSLGSILGTLFNAVDTDTQHVVLDVPGADPVTILLTSPSFSGEAAGFIGGLEAEGIFPGTQTFDQLIGIAKWVLDPADPQNASYNLVNAYPGVTLNAGRDAVIQYIEGDATIPNPTTMEMINAAIGQGGTALKTYEFVSTNTSYTLPAAGSRHGFMLNFAVPTTTVYAQEQVLQFIATDTVKTTFP